MADIHSSLQGGGQGGGQGGEVEGSVFSDDYDWLVLDAVVMPKDYASVGRTPVHGSASGPTATLLLLSAARDTTTTTTNNSTGSSKHSDDETYTMYLHVITVNAQGTGGVLGSASAISLSSRPTKRSGGVGVGGGGSSTPTSPGMDAAAVVVQGRLRLASQLSRQSVMEGMIVSPLVSPLAFHLQL